MEGIHRFQFDGELTSGQRAYYEENGFIVFGKVLSAEEVGVIKDDCLSLEARSLAGEIPQSDIDDLTPPSYDDRGRASLHRLLYVTRYCPRTREIVDSKPFLSIGRSLLGPTAWVLQDTMGGAIWMVKKGGRGSAYSSIRWHLDFPEDHELSPVVSAGIYLDESGADNGCLAVIPGSHRFPPGRVPPTPVLVEANPGDVICHGYNLFHGSGPVLQEAGERATLYLYLCGGPYPGPGLPFASEEGKRQIRQLFVGHASGGGVR